MVLLPGPCVFQFIHGAARPFDRPGTRIGSARRPVGHFQVYEMPRPGRRRAPRCSARALAFRCERGEKVTSGRCRDVFGCSRKVEWDPFLTLRV